MCGRYISPFVGLTKAFDHLRKTQSNVVEKKRLRGLAPPTSPVAVCCPAMGNENRGAVSRRASGRSLRRWFPPLVTKHPVIRWKTPTILARPMTATQNVVKSALNGCQWRHAYLHDKVRPRTRPPSHRPPTRRRPNVWPVSGGRCDALSLSSWPCVGRIPWTWAVSPFGTERQRGLPTSPRTG